MLDGKQMEKIAKSALSELDVPDGVDLYYEFVGIIADVKVGDEVLGSDGQWKRVVEVYPEFLPKTMFEVLTDHGSVKCSGDHQWTVFDDDLVKSALDGSHGMHVEEGNMDQLVQQTKLGVFDTENLAVVSMGYKVRLGAPNGPLLLDVVSIPPEPSCCILVESDDHQFEVLPVPAERGKAGVKLEDVE